MSRVLPPIYPPRTDREVRPVTIKGVQAERVTFYSPSLGRRKQYLVVRRQNSGQLDGFGVIYLLHGFGGEPGDWLRWSHLHDYLRDRKLIAVLPEGDNSYYVNAAEIPDDHYADYIVNDIPNDVETHYPVAAKRESRLIGGLSMGGYGAFYLGLKHPDRYWFVSSMSNAADAPTRKFSFERFGQYWRLRKIFGPPGSGVREEYDPFYLVKSVQIPRVFPTSIRRVEIGMVWSVSIACSIALSRPRTSTTSIAKVPALITGGIGIRRSKGCSKSWTR